MLLNKKSMHLSNSIYDFSVTTIDGQLTTLMAHKNKVMLIVNVASFCNFTSQYAGLEKLYQQYKCQGFVVLGFPCNQFFSQEPESAAIIKVFCNTFYNISFPMFAKINVNGKHAHPLYTFLKASKPGLLYLKYIPWNFTKFLVAGNGQVLKRFLPCTVPQKISQDIASLLSTS